MRLHILSDLHLEADPAFRPPDTRADVLILDGDIAPGTAGLAAFARHPGTVIYVPGNHEYYHSDVAIASASLRQYAADAGIEFLDCNELVLSGVRFLGATLWTDFALYGAADIDDAYAHAARQILDFRRITHRDRWLLPADTVDFHRDALAWLAASLDQPFSGPTVVITHHAPHPASIHPRWANNPVNPAFVSDLTPLMGKSCLWIHGHTHDSFDYKVSGTRVICNPKGYRNENRHFKPDLVIEV